MPYLAFRRAVSPGRRDSDTGPGPNFACSLLFLLALSMPAHGIYKWVDEKGVTHFSEHPPPDGKKATKVEPKVTPPSSEARPIDWKSREQEARKQRLERDQKGEYDKAKSHNQAADRANRCNFARRELHILKLGVPVYSRDKKGDRTYVEDHERPAEIAKMEKMARENCD